MRHLLLILMVALLGGCSQADHNTEIRFALSRAAINLDPRFATDAASERINRLIYQRLVEYDEQSHPVPGIAKWKKLSDRHYRFTLTGQQLFHNGELLTAADVVATYQSVLDGAMASPHRGLLEGIQRIVRVNDTSIDFFLNSKDNLFPGRLTIGILPADLIAARYDFHASPIGSGKFRFIAEGGVDDVLLQRQEDGQLIRFAEVRDPTVRLLKLVKGEVDILQNDIPPELYAWLARQDVVAIHKRPGSNYTYLGMNLRSHKLQDRRVRRAIAHAINRQALLKFLMHDRARPAESILSPEHWAGHKELQAYEYNPTRSRQLLEEAGWSASKPLKLVYKTSTDPLRIRIATIISDQLADVGIQVSLQSLDWGTFYGDIKSGSFELYSLSWVGIRSPDIFEYVFHSKSLPPAGANRGAYINSQVDTLVSSALYKNDIQDMHMNLIKVQQQLHADLPYIPLWYEDQFYAARADILGYELKADGNYDGLESVVRRVSEQ